MFASDIFRVLQSLHSTPTLAVRQPAWLAQIDLDAASIEWYPFPYERLIFNFLSPALGVNRKCANETNVTNGGHDEIGAVYRGEFTNQCVVRDFDE